MRYAYVVLLLTAVLASPGCGDANWGTVAGKVFVDGEPMKKGRITFEPVAGGASAYAPIASDGSFAAMTGTKAGLQVGDYIVTVVDHDIPEYGGIVKNSAPPQYAVASTSDLKATIKHGPNSLDFQLKK